MNMLLRYLMALGILAAGSSLQGCVSAAVTGVSSGCQVAYNHYNIQNSYHDQYTTMQVDHAIHWHDTTFNDSNIEVSTFNNILVLTGQVPTQTQREKLTQIARKTAHVKEIYNLTTVNSPASTLTHASDTWITAKIKSRLIAAAEIDPSQIKVLTENGNVYLIGTVFPEQAEIATDIARETAGVENVVRIFSYLHITRDLRADSQKSYT
jgi:osmotically-inducible protein OsmY